MCRIVPSTIRLKNSKFKKNITSFRASIEQFHVQSGLKNYKNASKNITPFHACVE